MVTFLQSQNDILEFEKSAFGVNWTLNLFLNEEENEKNSNKSAGEFNAIPGHFTHFTFFFFLLSITVAFNSKRKTSQEVTQ